MNEIYSKVRHMRTADEVENQIETLILEGILRVGDKLPSERELAKYLDVSRPILRDALKTLETRGLLATRQNGTYIADIIGQVFSPPIMDLVQKHPKAITDYLEYRREIEGIAAQYAAQRATMDDKALLTQIIERMKDAHARNDFQEEAAIDVEFHNAIGECAHNIILLHTLRSCYRLLSDGVFFNRAIIYTFASAREKLLDQHLAIYDAIMQADGPLARETATQHMIFVEECMNHAERTSDWHRISKLRRTQRSFDK